MARTDTSVYGNWYDVLGESALGYFNLYSTELNLNENTYILLKFS